MKRKPHPPDEATFREQEGCYVVTRRFTVAGEEQLVRVRVGPAKIAAAWKAELAKLGVEVRVPTEAELLQVLHKIAGPALDRTEIDTITSSN